MNWLERYCERIKKADPNLCKPISEHLDAHSLGSGISARFVGTLGDDLKKMLVVLQEIQETGIPITLKETEIGSRELTGEEKEILARFKRDVLAAEEIFKATVSDKFGVYSSSIYICKNFEVAGISYLMRNHRYQEK